jgi:hypothetical protein
MKSMHVMGTDMTFQQRLSPSRSSAKRLLQSKLRSSTCRCAPCCCASTCSHTCELHHCHSILPSYLQTEHLFVVYAWTFFAGADIRTHRIRIPSGLCCLLFLCCMRPCCTSPRTSRFALRVCKPQCGPRKKAIASTRSDSVRCYHTHGFHSLRQNALRG